MKITLAFLLTICCLLSNSSLFGASPSKDIAEIVAVRGKGDTLHFKNVKKFLLLPKQSLLLSLNDSIYIIDGNTLRASLHSAPVNAFCLRGDSLFIGTSNGLVVTSPSRPQFNPIPLPAREKMPDVTDICFDSKGTLWITTDGFGMFSRSKGAIKPYATAGNMSSVTATPDGSVWAGSNIGLYHLHPDGELKRYYEEIAAVGIAIPDNIVERLVTDNSNNLWIFMSQATSVLSPTEYSLSNIYGGGEDVDPHSYDYIGAKGNRIRHLLQRKNEKGSSWLLTDDGLYILVKMDLTKEEEGKTPDEIVTPKGNAKLINKFTDGKHTLQFPSPIDAAFDTDGSLVLATQTGMFRIQKKIIAAAQK